MASPSGWRQVQGPNRSPYPVGWGPGGPRSLHPAVYTHPLLALPSLGSLAARSTLWEGNPYRGAAWGGAPTKSVRTSRLALVVCWENNGQ